VNQFKRSTQASFLFLEEKYGFSPYVGAEDNVGVQEVLRRAPDLVVYRGAKRWVILGFDPREPGLGMTVQRRVSGRPLRFVEPDQVPFARILELAGVDRPSWFGSRVDDVDEAIRFAAQALRLAAPQLLENGDEIFEEARRNYESGESG